MSRILAFGVLASLFVASTAADEWLEVRSTHFTVISNARRGTAWTVADEFERIRSVYETALTIEGAVSSSPVVIFAVTDEASFRELAPWLGEDLLPAGLFTEIDGGARIVLRLDATDEGRYDTLYHEYHHVLLRETTGARLPSWVVEGLAEFWSQAVIRDDEVELGKPDPGHLSFLRDQRLMPLAKLLATYGFRHDAPRRAIRSLYAQSWALTHWILLADGSGTGKAKLDRYLELVANGSDSVEAFISTFGKLDEVEESLRGYLRQTMFPAMRIPAPEWNEEEFAVRTLSETESADLRADFLLSSGQTHAARRLLEGSDEVETATGGRAEQLGVLAYEDQALEEAARRFDEAIASETASHLSYYYRALLEKERGDGASLVADLERAIQLNPSYAPAYVELASHLARDPGQRERVGEMAAVALELTPDDRILLAQLGRTLLEIGRTEEARQVLARMQALPASPGSKAMDRALEQAIQREDAR